MPELPQTTAEDLLRAAEAVHLLGSKATTDEVSRFLGGSSSRARNALVGARELGFIQEPSKDRWVGTPVARMLAQATPPQKAVILRFHLEAFRPYALFRDRLVAGETPESAARQVGVKYGLAADTHEIERALKDFGAYCKGLSYSEDQTLRAHVNTELLAELLAIHQEVLDDRAAVQAHILDRVGPDAAGFLSGPAMDSLVDGYLSLIKDRDPRASVFHLGNAIEQFLKDLADREPALTVPKKVKTMGQYAQLLKDSERLRSKQYQIVMALVGLRNAADHQGDGEIDNNQWTIQEETAKAAHHLAWSFVRSWFKTDAGDHSL